jgi:hypothetical protein
MSRDPGRDERELQELLRNAAAVVLLGLFAVIVVVALFSEVLQDRELDTTLLLGLATSTVTAASALLGVQLVMRGK